jgi:hypothetical protein
MSLTTIVQNISFFEDAAPFMHKTTNVKTTTFETILITTTNQTKCAYLQ